MYHYANVTIRPIEERDLATMVRLREDPKIWMHLGDISMINLRAQTEWYHKLLTDSRRKYFILAIPDQDFIGIVRMDEIDWINRSARVGGDILSECQGRGYGTMMFTIILKYCFDFLNLNRLWLLVLEYNHVAQKLYTKMGFVEEGRQRKAIFRDGQYQDYIMMSLLRAEWRPQPPDPL